MAGRVPPSGPVRLAFLLVTSGAALVAAQTGAAAFLLLRFDAALTAHGPWSRPEEVQLDSMQSRLVYTVILGAGLAGLLAGAAMAVPRRSVGTRTVFGLAALLATVALLLGVVVNPDNALLAFGAAEEAHLHLVLPLWFSILSSVAVTGALASLAAAFVVMGREAAYDYYQYDEPVARWRGFSSWLAVDR